MTVSRLRTELTDAEFMYFAAYFDLKAEKERQESEKSNRYR